MSQVIGTTRAPTEKLRAWESGYAKSGPYNGWGRDYVLAGIRATQLPNSHRTVTICHIKACRHAASGPRSTTPISQQLSLRTSIIQPTRLIFLICFCALANLASD